MSQLAFSTLGCAELSLDEVGALAKKFGISKVELRALNDRLDLPALFRETYGSPERLAEVVTDLGIEIVVLDTSLRLPDLSDESRGKFLEFIPWAEVLGSKLRVFDGGKFGPTLADSDLEAAVSQVNWWRSLRSENEWQTDITVETHDMCCSTANILQLQEALDEPVPLLWDAWHVWFKNHEPIEETWSAIQPFVTHLHFKDGVREPIEKFPYRYEIPGTGIFPLEEFFEMVKRSGYQGAISLEWERKWHPYLPPLEEALAGLVSIPGIHSK